MNSMDRTREFLKSIGLPGGDAYQLPTSEKRFEDGGQYRFEVPGIQGPGPMKALLEALDEYGIKIDFSRATYIAGDTTGEIVNSGQGSQPFKISDGFNLGYIVIRHGNDFIIWTPRPVEQPVTMATCFIVAPPRFRQNTCSLY